MKGLGHFPMSENPQLFLNYLLPALEKISAIPGAESFAAKPFLGRRRSDADLNKLPHKAAMAQASVLKTPRSSRYPCRDRVHTSLVGMLATGWLRIAGQERKDGLNAKEGNHRPRRMGDHGSIGDRIDRT
jgi:hypothetical protein